MAATPSSCGRFVYSCVTSAVTKNPLVERGESFSTRLKKCFLSLMRGKRLLARCWIRRLI